MRRRSRMIHFFPPMACRCISTARDRAAWVTGICGWQRASPAPTLLVRPSTWVQRSTAVPTMPLGGFRVTTGRCLFGSERSGVSDIWISTRSSATNSWQPANNLGTPINNPSSYETTPYLSADGLTLFFNSDRHRPGNGSLWVSRRVGGGSGSTFGPPALIQHISDLNPRSADFPMLSADEGTLCFNTYPNGFPGRTVLWQSSITILPQLRALGRNPAGDFQLELLGREGATYEIEVSTDFSVWAPWLTTNTSASVLLSDPAPSPEGRRFYRALRH